MITSNPPWTADACGHISNAQGNTIGSFSDPNDADKCVAAVNAHAILEKDLEALRDTLEIIIERLP